MKRTFLFTILIFFGWQANGINGCIAQTYEVLTVLPDWPQDPQVSVPYNLTMESPKYSIWLAQQVQSGKLTCYKDPNLSQALPPEKVFAILFPNLLDASYRDHAFPASWAEIEEDFADFSDFEDDEDPWDEPPSKADSFPQIEQLLDRLTSGTPIMTVLNELPSVKMQFWMEDIDYLYGFRETWQVKGKKFKFAQTAAFIRIEDPGETLPPMQLYFPLEKVSFPVEFAKLHYYHGGIVEEEPKDVLENRRFNQYIMAYRALGTTNWKGNDEWATAKSVPTSDYDSTFHAELWKQWNYPAFVKKKSKKAAAYKTQTKGLYTIGIPPSLEPVTGDEFHVPGLNPADTSIMAANRKFYAQVFEPVVEDVFAKKIKSYDAAPLRNFPFAANGISGGEGSVQRALDHNLAGAYVQLDPVINPYVNAHEPYKSYFSVVGSLSKTGKKITYTPVYLVLTWVDPGETYPTKDFVAVKVDDIPYTIDGVSAKTYLSTLDYFYCPLSINGNSIYSAEEGWFWDQIFNSNQWKLAPGPVEWLRMRALENDAYMNMEENPGAYKMKAKSMGLLK